MATIEHEGYVARIDADDENNGFHGTVINISDVVNFKGRSMAELTEKQLEQAALS